MCSRHTLLRIITIRLERSAVVWAAAIRLYRCISTRMCQRTVQRWQDLRRLYCSHPSKCVTISNGSNNLWNSSARDRSNSNSYSSRS
uniref:Putative secreted peptide n=1 Tax=Anopheles braziliensis TaxID=58242 RepID=A0A2M3ZSY0_9DIPT